LCAPGRAGADRAAPWENARTYASGLRVPGAVGDFLILRALRESGGAAVAIPDSEMAAWTRRVGEATGIFCAPEGAATAAALPRLMEMGIVRPGDEVVLFNTGSGLKYVGGVPVEP
jgi:threonine synthase